MNITDFCGHPNDVRERFRTPFNLGDRTVATNGHIMLSVPMLDEYKDISHECLGKSVKEILVQIEAADFKPAPTDLEWPAQGDCIVCDGTGKAEIKECPECEGEGAVDVETDDNTCRDLECINCCGDGWILSVGGDDNCPTCNGTGKRSDYYATVAVDGVTVDPQYYKIIEVEDGLQISGDVEKDWLCFRAGAQAGVIMGKRAQSPITSRCLRQ